MNNFKGLGVDLPEVGEISERERGYWAGVVETIGLGPKRFFSLLKGLGSAEAIWKGKRETLSEFRVPSKIVKRLMDRKEKVDPHLHLEVLAKMGVSVVCIVDEEYPKLLREIDNPPPVLFLRGRLIDKDNQAVAVVGTRTPTAYGREVTEKLVTGLVASGLTVVSGLAYGIDAMAHRAALEAGGRTIAFLGGGIDQITPTGNRRLAEEISKNGAVVSEFAPGLPASRGIFPARNRLISGVSLGVVVVEGASKSGTKLTAEHAIRQKRPVLAVPGPITSQMSQAPTDLMKMGAKIVAGVEDILQEISISNFQFPNKHNLKSEHRVVNFDNEEEEKIYKLLENEQLGVDEIVRLSGLGVVEISRLLTMMEIRGLVRDVGGKVYGRC
jgi:DNA processing protein